MDILGHNRIIIIGNNGSGKSFLGRELSAITGIPCIHLDVEYWGPNWEQPTKKEWIVKQKELMSKEKWIIDGNHTGTMELRIESADLIIFLDINRLVCLYGVFRRLGKKRPDMPESLEERYGLEFLKFLKGVWRFKKTRRCKIIKMQNKYSDKQFLTIKSRKQLHDFLSQLKKKKLDIEVAMTKWDL